MGTVGTTVGLAQVNKTRICFAGVFGCGGEVPSDSYPIRLEQWMLALICTFSVVLVLLVCRLGYVMYRKRAVVSQLTEMEQKVAAIHNELEDVDQLTEKLSKRRESLIEERVDLQSRPPTRNDSTDILVKVEKLRKRRESLFEESVDLLSRPPTRNDSTDILVEVKPNDNQYWTVFNKMREICGGYSSCPPCYFH